MATSLRALQFTPTERVGAVSALLLRPPAARALLVLGHGAGAGMRHPFMQAVAEQLAAQKIATLRYQFPYMEKGKKSPDSQTTLRTTIVSAVATAKKAARRLPLLAGGKSMGGRLTSLVAAEGRLPDVRGLIFFRFSSARGRETVERAGGAFGPGARPDALLTGDAGPAGRTRSHQAVMSPPGQTGQPPYC